jgi:uncharacterized protein HemX
MHMKGTPLETQRASARARPQRGVRTRTSGGAHASLPATLAVIALALAVATFGVETNRDALALLGLGATGLLAATLAVSANRSVGRRDGLRAANTELRRRNGELEARRLAIESALDAIDDRTQGRLRELIEENGDELAEFVDDALDESSEGAP